MYGDREDYFSERSPRESLSSNIHFGERGEATIAAVESSMEGDVVFYPAETVREEGGCGMEPGRRLPQRAASDVNALDL